MRKTLLITLCITQIATYSFAQETNEEITDDLYSESSEVSSSKTTINTTDRNYNVQFSYETYTPTDRNEYSYQGINIDLQNKIKIDDSQLVMAMGPNISILGDKYKSVEENLVLIKWDQGVGYNFDLGDDVLLQPLVQLGLGYGWIDSEEDQNSAIGEIQAGINLIPNKDTNLYLKSGYRFFDLDNNGSNSIGNLKGAFAMAGLGRSF